MYLPKRKKIRGWKRRIAELDRWGEWIKDPDLVYFEKYDCTYERCTLYPFYMLEKRHPPLWFYRLILSKFISAYKNWMIALDQAGATYDLMIWLYDPAFIRSEIVSYAVDRIGDLAKFSWESNTPKPFPFQKFKSFLYDLHEFEWTLADEENVTFLSEMEDESEVEWYIKNDYSKKIQNVDEVYYAKRVGDIWIGRLKKLK